jgi:chromosome segregation ATPase
MAVLRQQADEDRCAIEQANSALTAANMETERAQARIQELEQALDRANAQCAEIETMLTQRTADLEQSQIEQTRLLNDRIAQLEAQAQALSEERDSLQHDLEVSFSNVVQL